VADGTPLDDRAPFATLWETLRLDALREHAPRSTITREAMLAATQAATPPRVTATPPSLHSLPRMSIALTGAAGGTNRAHDAASGGHVPDLVAVAVLGEGGMGRVLLAQQRSLGRDVAVKVLHEGPENGGVAASLLTEGFITGSLEHPSVIPVHALGVDDAGRPVLVMKRIEGVAWYELIANPDHPFWAKLPNADDRAAWHVEVLISVSNALHFAHSRRVVHRDVKPANVMIGEFGEVYLVDWGIALSRARTDGDRTAEGQDAVVGSPAYMAPEMVTGDVGSIDARTDVYLLGATLYEVLTGRPRHAGDTLRQALLAAYVSAPPTFPDGVASDLADLVVRATHVSPAMRPASALAFRTELAEHLRHRSSVALAERTAERLHELRDLLATPGGDDARHRARERFVECRFGFTQALRDWEGNRAAQAGLDECIVAMVALEIEQENAPAARALMRELREPPGDLEERVVALERSLALRAKREEHLASIERENDLSVSARGRTTAFLGIAVVVISVGAYLGLTGRASTVTVKDSFVISAGVVALAVVTLACARGTLLKNAINRRLTSVFFLDVVVLSAHRAIALLSSETISAVLTTDMLLQAFVFAIVGLLGLRWAWWGASICALATGAMLAEPALSPTMFSATMVGVIALSAVFSMRQRDAGDVTGDGGDPSRAPR